MTYNESLEYIRSLSYRGSCPGLERIKELLEILGNPHKKLRCVHITGTNGKGSVCAMLSSVLYDAGYNVGMYTSPYIENITEMFKYNGCDIVDNEFASLVAQTKDACDTVRATEYEFLTALAFLYFSKLSPDIVIIECCMGGLLDATNVINEPVLSVITSVAKDHTAFLGERIEDIAYHKAGIIKKNCPCLVSGCSDEAADVIIKYANNQMSDCCIVREKPENTVVSFDKTVFDTQNIKNLQVSLIGVHQANNALTVIKCCEILNSCGYTIREQNIRNGLKRVSWKARFEILCDDPLIIFDGCHNMHGVESIAVTLDALFSDQKLICITGVMKDKEYQEIASVMSRYAAKIYTVKPDNTRALDEDKLSEVYCAIGIDAEYCRTVKQALENALRNSRPNTPIFVFGSLYLYKQIKNEISGLLFN